MYFNLKLKVRLTFTTHLQGSASRRDDLRNHACLYKLLRRMEYHAAGYSVFVTEGLDGGVIPRRAYCGTAPETPFIFYLFECFCLETSIILFEPQFYMTLASINKIGLYGQLIKLIL